MLLKDVNDRTPVFQFQDYQSEVSEDSRIGSTVTTVQATDVDSAENTVVMHTSDLLPFSYSRTTFTKCQLPRAAPFLVPVDGLVPSYFNLSTKATGTEIFLTAKITSQQQLVNQRLTITGCKASFFYYERSQNLIFCARLWSLFLFY